MCAGEGRGLANITVLDVLERHKYVKNVNKLLRLVKCFKSAIIKFEVR